jgi:hypothetical protein
MMQTYTCRYHKLEFAVHTAATRVPAFAAAAVSDAEFSKEDGEALFENFGICHLGVCHIDVNS